jgi:hypothetical protein
MNPFLHFTSLLLLLQKPLTLQVFHNLHNTILHTLLIAPNMDLRLLGRLIRRTNPRKLLDGALPRLFIQALGVARLSYFERQVDEDFDEGEGLV